MAHSTRTARCQHAAFDEIECTIPYHRALIEEWKAAVPFSRRSFDERSKAWRFWGGYQDVAIELLLRFLPDAEVPRRARWQVSAPSAPAGSDHFHVLHLLPSAPRELIDAAYRALAKLHHPDLGGNPATMRRLSAAHDALSRRLPA